MAPQNNNNNNNHRKSQKTRIFYTNCAAAPYAFRIARKDPKAQSPPNFYKEKARPTCPTCPKPFKLKGL